MKFRVGFRVFFLSALAASVLGCANSASHRVVPTEKVGDTVLSCGQLRTEKRKVQVIINGVEQDKSDMTGADFVDGLLWFPFNVIAKQANYSSAVNAAEGRIAHLTLLEMENGCLAGSGGMTADADKDASRQLQQLNSLYREGVLTQDEYINKRTKILDSLTPVATTATAIQSQKQLGQYSHKIESLAVDRGCRLSGSSALLSKMGPVEVYQVNCKSAEPLLARCEYQDCTFFN